MSEHRPEPGGQGDERPDAVTPTSASSQDQAEPARTGLPEVDDVLASLEGLDDRPVDEHVAVFESAHERLRGSLDGPAGA